ncbi:MAG: tRNA (adenosine(37)-N6)-threonylcarbamoyltransferase complex dimerization subunit type 1 TsaB [Defluviitoga tunisiensis]|jgi:tRNA threonylcarbamoyladenosine biosynthesis protein TsaB|nr:tRNA (adenosine(37)-N6)-threonylcarbamoyltransferase complex dimerization subunit type 1 TsaB [Defluviitoga tunisiensis]MDY0378931.1 tRNA (adenosine(37)-N6)-threonylcarbamoyltransferase complex dimerization subunit type 1 TsaB [Defluviitoga tunisiensis]HHV01590.1 tRNA (adenosine(37)-N6)-threonylcarbamoyltransferase complex dimerization subunit type 1 TsaB [Defluviitoga tunisiensis]HOB55469.1 tRNA (adenosine(37)-N6)-threonylcarbamoyltransferase complex dimerization subunit type 1 TsaB [Defluvi
MEESNLLILSTSLDEMFVMLKDKNNKIYKKNLLGKKSGNYLASAINDIFKETNLKINDVEEYAVDIGPGSFTGIRVAIATLQGMLVSQPEKEVRTFLSSDFIYLSSLTKNKNYLIDKKLAVLKRARENAAYVALYQNNKRIFGPEMVFYNRFDKILNESILINKEAIYFKEKYHLENELLISELDSQSVIEVALRGKRVKVEELKPLYLQKPIAVENYEKNKK